MSDLDKIFKSLLGLKTLTRRRPTRRRPTRNLPEQAVSSEPNILGCFIILLIIMIIIIFILLFKNLSYP